MCWYSEGTFSQPRRLGDTGLILLFDMDGLLLGG